MLSCGTLSPSSPGVAGRKTIVTRPRPVYKRDEQVIADALHVRVLPNFEWIRDLRPCAGVAFDLIRWAVDNVHVAAIGLPARPAGCCPKTLVGIRNAAIVFFQERVFFSRARARRRTAPLPKLLDELLPFVIGSQFLECRALF